MSSGVVKLHKKLARLVSPDMDVVPQMMAVWRAVDHKSRGRIRKRIVRELVSLETNKETADV